MPLTIQERNWLTITDTLAQIMPDPANPGQFLPPVPVDLTGATVALLVTDPGGNETSVSGVTILTPPTAGKVSIVFKGVNKPSGAIPWSFQFVATLAGGQPFYGQSKTVLVTPNLDG